MTVINQTTCTLFTDAERFTQLAAYYEAERRTVWMMLRATPRPCFNHALIEEIMNLSWLVRQSGFIVDFWVTGSLVPDIYNTGGDLQFFVECIKNNRREALRAYARACVDCVHAASRGFDTGAVTLAMMDALEASEEDAEDISAYVGQVEGVVAAVTIRELRPGECKLSVRTTRGLNASAVCALLGGGGHAAAAGCTVMGSVEEAKAAILRAIEQVKHGS